MSWDRYAIIDVETTGFSPAADRVVEMACVLVDGDSVVDRWASLVNPGLAIPAHATAIHGITDRMVSRAPRLGSALAQLRRRCAQRVVAAHCARFDLSFVGELPSAATLCTMRLARVLVPEAPNHKNQTLRAVLRIDRYLEENLGAHRALDDALVTAHIFLECRRRFDRRYPGVSWKRFLRAKAVIHPTATMRRAS